MESKEATKITKRDIDRFFRMQTSSLRSNNNGSNRTTERLSLFNIRQFLFASWQHVRLVFWCVVFDPLYSLHRFFFSLIFSCFHQQHNWMGNTIENRKKKEFHRTKKLNLLFRFASALKWKEFIFQWIYQVWWFSRNESGMCLQCVFCHLSGCVTERIRFENSKFL